MNISRYKRLTAQFGQSLTAFALCANSAFADDAPSLVKQMTSSEEIGQMLSTAPANHRLHLHAYNWWSEGLHGIARNGYATVFPQAIGLAATWDADLLRRVGDVVSTEARAKFNAAGGVDADHAIYGGLAIWSPNINIFRDPRWGRGQETYGEDPYLTGTLAVAFIGGIQGPDPDHPKAIATAKHFAVHSGPEAGRHGFDVDVSPYDLEATYLPAFRRAVTEGQVQSVMCAYNSLHGAPACANDLLLRTRLRADWGFKGYVVSDCDAVEDMAQYHFQGLTSAEASAQALRSGTDLNCGWAFVGLNEALAKNRIGQGDLDVAATRLFEARHKLGMDGGDDRYATIGAERIHTPQAAKLAQEAARKSIVLLKNNGVLPLKTTAHIAVIGPDADTLETLEANYHGTAIVPVTPLAGLRAVYPVAYAQGASVVEGMPLPIPETALHVSDAAGAAPGLVGEYFDNPGFAGAARLVRTDRTVDLDLDHAAPVSGFEKSPYGVRWSGYLTPPGLGDYRLEVRMERCWDCHHDQVKLILDDAPVIEDLGDGTSLSANLHFDDVKAHKIRLEFQHVGADAGLRLQWSAPASAQLDEAKAVIAGSDAVVAVVGLSPDVEGEELSISAPGFDGGDRTSLDLPAGQLRLLEAAKAGGKPLVVVLMSGGAVALNWAKEHADAILTAWYPGESGGDAIAATLSGANNPSGRLPVTFYRSSRDLPTFIDYRMTGRTYRYFDGETLYPFGFGLSYTHFGYAHISAPRSISAGDDVTVSALVSNLGAAEGDEVAQVYLTPPGRPQGLKRSLVGFQRLHLKPGESRKVEFKLASRDLSLVSLDGERAIEPGAYQLFVGGGQPGDAPGISAPLNITGRQSLSH